MNHESETPNKCAPANRRYASPLGAGRRVGMAAALDAVGILVPGLSTAVESGRTVFSRKSRNTLRWQAFVVTAEEKMRGLNDSKNADSA
jgi:hypothetical protein